MTAAHTRIAVATFALFAISGAWALAREGTNPSDQFFDLGAHISNSPRVEQSLHQGHVYLLDGDARKALKIFRAVSRIDSKCGAALIGEARCYQCLGAYGPAFETLKKAMDCGPEGVSTGALWESAFLHRELSQFELSEKEYLTLLKKKTLSQRDYILVQVAELYQRWNKHSEAIKYANEALKIDPHSHFAHFVRAQSYMILKKNEAALADLNAAIEEEHKRRKVVFSEAEMNYYQRRVELYKKMNRPDLAKKDEEKIKKLREDVFEVVPFRMK